MIPLAGGLFWLLELLPYLGLSFNLANFFSLPILIGIGVDGGVHVMHRFRETASTDDVLRTTGSAVTLSFVTTILGFGALSFAQHRGVASLGYLTVLGSSTICLANTLLLPALLELWTRAKRR
jgi:predicted RND superfamily exporter protein